MKGSLLVVSFFALGCLIGWSDFFPEVLLKGDISMYILYLLMFQVGISIGSDKKLKDILRSIHPKLLLIPLATMIGTFSAVALVSLLLPKWSISECLAVGSGFRLLFIVIHFDYSIKDADLRTADSHRVGYHSLIANLIREIMTLLGSPLFVKYFGRLAPICAGAATTMDTTLPIITRLFR